MTKTYDSPQLPGPVSNSEPISTKSQNDRCQEKYASGLRQHSLSVRTSSSLPTSADLDICLSLSVVGSSCGVGTTSSMEVNVQQAKTRLITTGWRWRYRS
jgi:hypothetical protein